MHFHSLLRSGFVLGFLFGTLGIWALALLSLMLQPVELISQPLFAFGRWLSAVMITDGSASNLEVAALFLGNGIFYGVIGMLLQFAMRAVRR